MPSVLQQSAWVEMVEGRTGRDDVEGTEWRAGRGVGGYNARDRRAM